MNIGEILAFNANDNPAGEALVFEGRRLTWAELDAGANRAAGAVLAQGTEPGDRVIYLLNNSVEFVEIFFGLAKAGCIGSPLVPSSQGREIAHAANDLGARFILCEAGLSAQVESALGETKTTPGVIGVGDGHPFALDYATLTARASADAPSIEVPPDADLAVKYTSGTTGAPKGCVRTHRQLIMASATNLVHIPQIAGDRATISSPLAAGAAISLLALYVLGGSTMILLPKFDAARLLETIEREAVTIAYANGSLFPRVAFHPDLDRCDLSSLRIFSGSSSSPTANMAEGLGNFRDHETFRGSFFSAYASSEGGGRVSYLMPADCERALTDPGSAHLLTSVGRAVRLGRIEAMDEDLRPLPAGEVGEMAVRAPSVFKGYWNRPEETAKVLRDGWLMTGDLVRKDDEGFCYIAGRLRDVIRSGGMNVYPAEVEPVLASHEKIANAAIVGVVDEKWGEKVIACVVARDGCTEDEILAFCRERLAGHKRPKQVVFLESLPMNANAKVLKDDLRKMLEEETPQ